MLIDSIVSVNEQFTFREKSAFFNYPVICKCEESERRFLHILRQNIFYVEFR